jgi:hypothetical protein
VASLNVYWDEQILSVVIRHTVLAHPQGGRIERRFWNEGQSGFIWYSPRV